MTISVSNGAAFISAVALKLNELGITVRELTLRTPTLDDVFPASYREPFPAGERVPRRRERTQTDPAP